MQKLLHLPHCCRARGIWDGEGEREGVRRREKDGEGKIVRRKRGREGGWGDYKGTGKEKSLGCMCSYIDSKHLYLGLLRINPLTQKLHMNMWAGGPGSEYQS